MVPLRSLGLIAALFHFDGGTFSALSYCLENFSGAFMQDLWGFSLLIKLLNVLFFFANWFVFMLTSLIVGEDQSAD